MNALFLALSVAWGQHHIDVDVVGPLAEVTLTRTFVHAGEQPIDARLILPVPANSAIDGLTVKVGDRIIRGRVVEASEAHRTYAAAAAQGKAAALLEEAGSDRLVQDIANVQPGEIVEVEVRLVTTVERRGGIWTFTLPLTSAPRFEDPLDVMHVVAAPAEPLAPWVAPPVPGVHRGSVGFRVDAGTPIAWLDAPTHPFHAAIDGATGRLTVSDVPFDRDLVVRWQTALPDPTATLLVSDNHGLLVLEAPAPWARVEPGPMDLVVLVDGSDSMFGQSSQVLPIVEHLFAGLRHDDRATLLRFADGVEGFAIRDLPDEASRKAALLRDAPIGGGTELAQALRAALALPSPPDRGLTVVLVSDGSSGSVQEALDVCDARPEAVIHTVAVGLSPDRTLLDSLARKTGGISVVLSPGPVDEALEPLRAALRGPVFSEIWVAFDNADVLQAPPLFAPLYADQAAFMSLHLVDCATTAVVSGKLSGRDFAVTVAPRCIDRARPLAVLWARALMRQSSAASAQATAVEYQVLGPGTAFVGVAEEQAGEVAVAQAVVPLLVGDPVAIRLSSTLTRSSMSGVLAGKPFSADALTGAGGAENTYVLDGSNLTDPLAGTFAPRFPAFLARTDILTAGLQPELPGADWVVAWGAPHHEGSRLRLSGGLAQSGPLGAGEVTLGAEGDVVAFTLHAETDVQQVAGLQAQRVLSLAQLSLTPRDHRLTLLATGDLGSVSGPNVQAERPSYGGYVFHGDYHWFATKRSRAELVGTMLQRVVGDVSRGRKALSARVTHDNYDWLVSAGAGLSQVAFVLPGLGQAPQPPDLAAAFLLGNGFAQARWSDGGLTGSGGLRFDAFARGPVLPSPRIGASWDPWQDQRTKIAVTASRYHDVDRALPAALASTPGPTVPRSDELTVVLEREIADDLAVFAHGFLRSERFAWVPAPELAPIPSEAVTVDRMVPSVLLGGRKVYSRRWATDAGITLRGTPWVPPALLASPAAPFVPGFLTAYRPYTVHGSLTWEVPRLDTVLSGSLSHASAIPGLRSTWWTATTTAVHGRLTQAFGAFTGDLSVAFVRNDVGGTLLPLEALSLATGTPLIGEQPPVWVTAGLTAEF